jgi:hypothetical protein
MFVRAGEFLRVMGRAGVHDVRVAVDGDTARRDPGLRREPHFNLIVPRIGGAGVDRLMGVDTCRSPPSVALGSNWFIGDWRSRLAKA